MCAGMTGDEYKAALAKLGWTNEQMADALGISARTSFTYSARGAPRSIALAVRFLVEQGSKGE